MIRLPRGWPAYLVLFVALTATLIGTRYAANTVRAKDRDRFENAVQTAVEALHTRLDTYVDVLLGAAGLLAVNEVVTRAEFHAYVERLDLGTRYPGIQGVGYSVRIPAGREAETERFMRAQGQPDFRIWPAGRRGEKHAILHIEPLDGRNSAAVGYDMFSEPVRRQAMERARDTGRAAASGRVILVRDEDAAEQSGLLIYVPVYRRGSGIETVDQRRVDLLGFVYGVFRVDDLLGGIFASQSRPRVTLEVYDGDRLRPTLLLGRAGEGATRIGGEPQFSTRMRSDAVGRPWMLQFATTAAFEQASQRGVAGVVAACGIPLSFLLFGVTWLQWRAREAAERLAVDLRESEGALRDTNRGKDEFLAMLGHELRNPLGAMTNAVTILRRSRPEDPAFARALEVVERQLGIQNRLLSDLLDVSRVTSGRLQLERRIVDVDDLVRNSVAAHRAGAERSGHELTLVSAGQPLAVEGDPARLDQIVSNLLSNAIKYTPGSGHISVTVTRDGNRAMLRVSDDGIGMAKELVPKVFDPFVQGERALDRSQGGLGLGLTLVRRLVEMHGGNVSAHSAGPGLGSELVIHLPLVEPSRLRAAPSHVPDSKDSNGGRRVLVIEDIEDARLSLADLLEGWGCKVSVAADGPQGLRVALADPPDIALIDIGLPGMDGYEIARRLRDSVFGEKIRLIAVTGYGQPEDRRAALEAGFDSHIVKPLDPVALRRLLADL